MYKSYANALDGLMRFFMNETEGIADQTYPAVSMEQKERILSEFTKIQNQYKCSLNECYGFMQQLWNEQIIENIPETTLYRITFKGRDFIKQSGYTKECRNKQISSFVNSASSLFLIAGAIATIVIAYIEAYRFVEKTSESDKKGKPLNQQILRNTDTICKSKILLKK